MPQTSCEHLSSEALRLMASHNIAPTPLNYALWYDYAGAHNKALIEELDKAVSHQVTLDDATSEYLYRKYIAPLQEQEPESNNARMLLADILKVISAATDETEHYHRQIDEHIADLQSNVESVDLKDMVNAIVQSATGLKKSGETLHQNLSESRAEIEVLRRNLQEATNEAQRDFLTGLFNRKAFDTLMDELIAFASKEKTPLTLLMIDVDYFKRFNDEFGHLIGDEVLKMVARLLKDTVKGTDVVARFGGEEFAVILPHTPLDGARVVAENIRRAIANKELKHKQSGTSFGSVTVSIGIAEQNPGDTVPMVVKRADEALFSAKHAGRNTVSAAENAHAA